MQSVNRFVPDAANALRAADAAAITTDTAISAGALVSPIGAIWNDAAKDGKVVLFFKTSDIFDDNGDETYTIEVITSAASNLGTPTVHLSHVLKDGGSGAEDVWHEIIVDQHSLLKAAPTHKYWGVNINVAGTDPSLKVEMYLLPPVGL